MKTNSVATDSQLALLRRTMPSHAPGHWFALVLTLAAGAAQAHTDQVTSGGFMAGYLHPLTGLDHVLAMVAVGVWGATVGRPHVWALPLAFTLAMMLGAAVGMAGVSLPLLEQGIAASVVALGMMILAGWRARPATASAVVAIIGLLHGFAHGAELPGSAAPGAYVAGFVVAAGLLQLAGVGIGTLKRLAQGSRLIRAGGGLIAAAGVWIFAGTLGSM